MSENTYSVYLVEQGNDGGKRQVTSPVQGHGLEFYDTGVWLDRETGRNFFPYEQIRTIREHQEGEPVGSEAGMAGESERAGGESEPVGDEGDPAERESDQGAEEDLLEE